MVDGEASAGYARYGFDLLCVMGGWVVGVKKKKEKKKKRYLDAREVAIGLYC